MWPQLTCQPSFLAAAAETVCPDALGQRWALRLEPEIGLLDDRIIANLRLRAGANDPAVFQDVDAVSEPQALMHVLLHQDDLTVTRGDGAEDREQILDQKRAQPE